MVEYFSQLSPEKVIYALDIFGVIGCAMAGTILAYRQNFDPLGSMLIAAVTAIGGGTIRDVLVDRHPVFWLADLNYLIVIILVSLLTQLFFSHLQRIERILRITDAIGLGTYTIIGIEVALSQNMSPMICIFMGVITSSFGGIMRDIICNEVPLLFRKEVYLSASITGGICFFILLYLDLDKNFIYLISGGCALAVRLMAIYRGWNIPALGQR